MNVHLPIAKINNNACSPQKKTNTAPSFGAWEVKPNTAEKLINIGDNFPTWAQRLISGVTGIMLQPWFDLNNKRVDEDTQKISTARTCAKIIAGTLTGVSIRWACVEATKKFTRSEHAEKELENLGKLNKKLVNKPIKDINKILLPKSIEKASYKEISKYRQALGTYAGLLVMVATNFLVDAPLTTYLTNKFAKKTLEKQANNQDIQGGKQ